mgnify:CR=1 FL=1
MFVGVLKPGTPNPGRTIVADLTQLGQVVSARPCTVCQGYGTTVPQAGSFFAGPLVAARIGLPGIGGPTISQACATSVAGRSSRRS